MKDLVKATDHPDVIGGIVWSPLELRWINEYVKEYVAQLEQGRDTALAALDAKIDICGDERIRALKAENEGLRGRFKKDQDRIACQAEQLDALKSELEQEAQQYEDLRQQFSLVCDELAALKAQEPVAWMWANGIGISFDVTKPNREICVPLFNTPQPAAVPAGYTKTHATWTGAISYVCNTCAETFRSEHAAHYHCKDCQPPRYAQGTIIK